MTMKIYLIIRLSSSISDYKVNVLFWFFGGFRCGLCLCFVIVRSGIELSLFLTIFEPTF